LDTIYNLDTKDLENLKITVNIATMKVTD